MDPNTNNPITPNPSEPAADSLPQKPDPTFEPVGAEPSSPQPQVFVADTTPTTTPPNNPSEPIPPQAPSSVISPTQSPPPAAVSPTMPAPDLALPTAPLGQATPPPPVVVSGGFQPSTPASPVVGNFEPPSQTATTPPPAAASPKNSRLKPLIIAIVAIIVLVGGSAAAYFGDIVPNQPANVLKASLVNSLEQNSDTFTATVNYVPNSNSHIPAVQVTARGSRNAAAKTGDVALGFNGYGINLNLEARLVNQNLYVKAGNLSTVAGLVGTYDAALAAPAKAISDDVSNQWIEVDQSLLDEAGLSCVLNNNFSFTQADINVLSSDYSQHPFLIIQKTLSTTVNGQSADEFQVNINNNTAASFANNLNLNNLSIIKALSSCKGFTSSKDTVKGNGKTTPLNIWVSKDKKQIVQISYPETTQDKGKVTDKISLNYNNVSLTAPTNAEPALQLYTKLLPTLQSAFGSSGLNLSNLLSGLESGSSDTTSL